MHYVNMLMSLFSLVVLEIVLGIDNLVLLSILTQRLPNKARKRARYWGLMMAWVTRLLLLASALLMVHLTQPLFYINNLGFSGRDIFLLLGGVFLLYKSTQEIHNEIEDPDNQTSESLKPRTKFFVVVLQIAVLDIIFSLDSVLTAVGLTSEFWIMALAITLAVLVMLFASEKVNQFIEDHPTLKMLALSFLILVGVMLVADGFSFHVPRAYVYFAMLFSLGVECLNLVKKKRMKKNR